MPWAHLYHRTYPLYHHHWLTSLSPSLGCKDLLERIISHPVITLQSPVQRLLQGYTQKQRFFFIFLHLFGYWVSTTHTCYPSGELEFKDIWTLLAFKEFQLFFTPEKTNISPISSLSPKDEKFTRGLQNFNSLAITNGYGTQDLMTLAWHCTHCVIWKECRLGYQDTWFLVL